MTEGPSSGRGRAGAFEVDLEAEAFAGAFAFAPTGMKVVFDLDGRIRLASPALCVLLGPRRGSALVGGSIADFVPPHERRAIQRWLDAGADGPQKPARGESWFTRHDGIRLYGVVEAVFVTNEAGERRYGLVMAHDHTEARTLEETLRANAHRFRALVKNVSDTVSIIGADGTIEFSTTPPRRPPSSAIPATGGAVAAPTTWPTPTTGLEPQRCSSASPGNPTRSSRRASSGSATPPATGSTSASPAATCSTTPTCGGWVL